MMYLTSTVTSQGSDEWDKLRFVGGHTYIYQRCDYHNRGPGCFNKGKLLYHHIVCRLYNNDQ